MRQGLFLPIFDELADPIVLADLAAEAEASGWDGCFVWDHIYFREPVLAVTDPTIALAAMAMRTTKLVLGPMVTPLARRRPQVLARQLAALDRLSGGRIVFGTGLGLDSSGGELSRFGEETNDRRRAEMLDEGTDLLRALLSGDHVDHWGEFYRASDVRFLPRPIQDPLPFWLAARWPYRRPLRRAAKYEGVFLIDVNGPDNVAAAGTSLEGHGCRPEFDLVVRVAEGTDPRPWGTAGATWCLVAFDPFTTGVGDVRRVIGQGPVRL